MLYNKYEKENRGWKQKFMGWLGKNRLYIRWCEWRGTAGIDCWNDDYYSFEYKFDVINEVLYIMLMEGVYGDGLIGKQGYFNIDQFLANYEEKLISNNVNVIRDELIRREYIQIFEDHTFRMTYKGVAAIQKTIYDIEQRKIELKKIKQQKFFNAMVVLVAVGGFILQIIQIFFSDKTEIVECILKNSN